MSSVYNGVEIMADIKPTDRFVVIGGQYRNTFYGACPTLLGAKRLAGKNPELFDNFGGFHVPYIYAIEDVHFTTVEDFDPNDIFSCYARPEGNAEPVWGGHYAD